MERESLENGREAQTVRAALGSLPRMAAPDDLWPGLRRRIQAERLRAHRRHVFLHRVVPAYAPMAAAAAVVAAFAVFSMFWVMPPPIGCPSPLPPEEVAQIGPVADMNAILAAHDEMANERLVSGDELLAAESAFESRLAAKCP